MKIRIYIVTYRRNDVLSKNLESLWRTAGTHEIDRVVVLGNHPEDVITESLQRPELSMIRNTVRMPLAWGNLSKDWNFGLLDGFRDSSNPDNVDWVILVQNDVVWKEGWWEALERMNHLDFMSQPTGDQAMAFRIDAVRRVGFFDERLSTIHAQECDYFMRSIIALGERASINDDHKGEKSVYNKTGEFLIYGTNNGNGSEEDLRHTPKFLNEQLVWYLNKWKLRGTGTLFDYSWECRFRKRFRMAVPNEHDWYPFFWKNESDIPQSLHWQYEQARQIKAYRGIRRGWMWILKVASLFRMKT